MWRGRGSADFHQLDVEHQRGIRGDRAAGAARAIAHLRRDDEGALAAHLHSGHALVPAADHLSRAQLEIERRAAIHRAVELLAVAVGLGRIVQPAGVVDTNGTRARFGAGAFEHVDLLQLSHRKSPQNGPSLYWIANPQVSTPEAQLE